ncbi:hypothetical protein GIB67_015797 [Kingdonia uniflora]|uniref:Glycosyl hydrolase family 38 C-terminal domain-containing protein n=1 Tax=Kingdonia uniflora TaxID=39325 RepID=A0A7J7NUG0_9MAGN|nr:hypothetical protein GIB67_015797 [Kingdonia uniflora]
MRWAEAVVNLALSCLTNSSSGEPCTAPSVKFRQVVVAYNPLGWGRTDIIRISVSIYTFVCWSQIELGYLDMDISSKLGIEEITGMLGGKRRIGSVSATDGSQNDTVEVGPGNLKMSFSATTGQLKRMANSKTGVDIPIQQSYLWYGSSSGDMDPQASGAYIFRHNGSPPVLVSRAVPLKIIRGPLVHEVHQQFNPWIYQVIILFLWTDLLIVSIIRGN